MPYEGLGYSSQVTVRQISYATGATGKTFFSGADFSPQLDYVPGVGALMVFVGSVYQPPTEYQETNKNTITFNSSSEPPNGVSIIVIQLTSIAVNDVIPGTAKGAANGVATLDANGELVQKTGLIPGTAKGAANGVATLDANGELVQKTGLAAYAVAGIFTAQQGYANSTLTDAATIAWDLSTQQVATITINGARTMGAPINQVANTFYSLAVIQGSGGNTLAWDAVFKFPNGTAPVLSTLAGERDEFVFKSDGTNMHLVGQAINV